MTLKFNSLNITSNLELREKFSRPYLDYLKEMDGSYIGQVDGAKITSDAVFYQEILEAMGGKFAETDYQKHNMNWFYDEMRDMDWFEDFATHSHYKNYVLLVYNYEKMIEPNGQKIYASHYIEVLEDIVNWWTEGIITFMQGGINARRNFTILLVKEKESEEDYKNIPITWKGPYPELEIKMKGGDVYRNLVAVWLPEKDANGKTINYQQYDIENGHSGQRLLNSSDNFVYYTDNFYDQKVLWARVVPPKK